MKTRIAILFTIVLLLVSCKSKEIITEKVVKTVDSTAIVELTRQLSEKTLEVEVVSTELSRVRNEYTHLQSEINTHTINYDTAGTLNTDSWQYPKSSETITSSKSDYINRISELESQLADKNTTIDKYQAVFEDIRKVATSKTEENREMKSKTIPQTGFNFRLFFIGLFSGGAICLILIFRKNIRKYLSFLPGT